MNGRRIVIGVTGGIAAFKTAALVSQLVQNGADVRVTLSRAAEAFVGPPTFAALTGERVLREVFDEQHPLGAHIYLADHAELFCVAPATANFLAKAAHGIADDLLTTLYLACSCPVLLAPAMNDRMWNSPAVQRNLKQLRDDGVQFVDPEEGWLSCRTVGKGRMAAPEAIYSAIERLLNGS
jgi:phosphopantothenoylcysteine decarboxylase/phosphopantothenate--cysteine ligase